MMDSNGEIRLLSINSLDLYSSSNSKQLLKTCDLQGVKVGLLNSVIKETDVSWNSFLSLTFLRS